MSDETAPPPEAPAPTPPNPRCRALAISGHRCKNDALHGLHLCFIHYNHRYPALPDPKNVVVPFLEDEASISLMLTQVTHGLLSNHLDPVRARTTIYGLQVAGYIVAIRDRRLAREARAAAAAAKAGAPPPQPVPDEQVIHLGCDYEGFVSADGDLPEPNPLCPDLNAGPVPWDLADQVHPINQPAVEQRFSDPPSPDDQSIHGQAGTGKPEDPWGDEQREKREQRDRQSKHREYVPPYRRPKSQYEHPGPGERYYCPSATHGCLGPRYDHCCNACRRRQKKLDATERDPIHANLVDDLRAAAERILSPELCALGPAEGNTQNTLPSRPNEMKCIQNRPTRGVPLNNKKRPALARRSPTTDS